MATTRRKAPARKAPPKRKRRKAVEKKKPEESTPKKTQENASAIRQSIASLQGPAAARRARKEATNEPVPKVSKADKKSEKPLKARRTTRRAAQYPEGKYNPQLMVLIRKFQCLRCGDIQNVVWSDARKKEVMKNGGLPCPRCDLSEE